MTTTLAPRDSPGPPLPSVLPPDTTDAQLVEIWLAESPARTVNVYLAAFEGLMLDLGGEPFCVARRRRNPARLQHALDVGLPLRAIRLPDLQRHAAHLIAAGLKPSTRNTRISAIKSLFTFAIRTGYLHLDPARALRVPKRPDTLSARILAQETIAHVIAAEPCPRHRLLLRFLYATGGRISESLAVRWEDCQPHEAAAVCTFQEAKGGKPRTVRLPVPVWQELARVRPDPAQGHVFVSRRKGRGPDHPIGANTAWRWVSAAGRRVGVKLSPHWFRHAHASHALDRGAPVHLVCATLGHASLDTTTKYSHARPGESSGDYLDLGGKEPKAD